MKERAVHLATALTVLILPPGACKQGQQERPPPQARRPILKTEAELMAERADLVQAGVVRPTTAPVIVDAERRPRPPRRPPRAIRATPGAIQGEVLMVNDAVLTVSEVLYPLRDRIREVRASQTRSGFLEQLRRWVRTETRTAVGSLLVYEEAGATLEDAQWEMLDKAVTEEMDKVIAHEFGGSKARLDTHLQRYGLTLDQFRDGLRRVLLVRAYTREMLMPQVQLRREELLTYYRNNIGKYTSPELRELLIIEAPFERFLPDGLSWEAAAPAARAKARLLAMRHIRAAASALQEAPFGQVAREFSRGLHAEEGGSWGQIGRPLQAPYDRVSKLIFDFDQGQVSEPLETPSGWYIVKCGSVKRAQKVDFAEAQEEIRSLLTDRRFNELAGEYVIRLAADASISSLDAFIEAAVRRAGADDWPAPPPGSTTPVRH